MPNMRKRPISFSGEKIEPDVFGEDDEPESQGARWFNRQFEKWKNVKEYWLTGNSYKPVDTWFETKLGVAILNIKWRIIGFVFFVIAFCLCYKGIHNYFYTTPIVNGIVNPILYPSEVVPHLDFDQIKELVHWADDLHLVRPISDEEIIAGFFQTRLKTEGVRNVSLEILEKTMALNCDEKSCRCISALHFGIPANIIWIKAEKEKDPIFMIDPRIAFKSEDGGVVPLKAANAASESREMWIPRLAEVSYSSYSRKPGRHSAYPVYEKREKRQSFMGGKVGCAYYFMKEFNKV